MTRTRRFLLSVALAVAVAFAQDDDIEGEIEEEKPPSPPRRSGQPVPFSVELERWWSVWGTRLLSALAIVLFLEYRNRDSLLWGIYDRYFGSAVRAVPAREPSEPVPRDVNSGFLAKLEAEAEAARLAAEEEAKKEEEELQKKKLQKIKEEEEKEARARAEGRPQVGVSKTKLASAKKKAAKQKKEQEEKDHSNKPLTFTAKTGKFPGMDGFHHWYDVETSLTRVYTLGRNDDEPVIPGYIPHSYRGNVKIFLHVTNDSDIPIKVFWVSYKGQHVHKGDLMPGMAWTQTTYIDHPWVFEHADTQAPLLYYIPYRAIPTLPTVPTMTEDGIGRHEFRLQAPKAESPYWLSVQDKVMPFAGDYRDIFPEPLPAITWTLQQMSRDQRTTDMLCADDTSTSTLDTLRTFLNNIAEHPEVAKYRRLRLSSPHVAPIWMSPARGLLLAIGFVEVGGHVELGCAEVPLERGWVQNVALLSYLVQKWQKEEREQHFDQQQQPQGADGFGRAGFGRAGTIN